MRFDKLNQLKKSVIEEAQIVETMLKKTLLCLPEKNDEIQKAVEEMEAEVNQMEIDIEALGTICIALYQPEAKSLRTILMVLKINNELERMGDLIVKIMESIHYLHRNPPLRFQEELTNISQLTIQMLRDSISAFLHEDAQLARDVCKRDDIVDYEHKNLFLKLISLSEDIHLPLEIAFNINRISKNLERIADLSTNIAEETIFMSQGRVIKHQFKEEYDEE